MRKYIVLVILSIFSYNAFNQIHVNEYGRVNLDGQGGQFSLAPRAVINSDATGLTSFNNCFTLFNTNTTPNNFVRLQFGTKNNDSTEEDYVSLATQYKDRSLAEKSGDFHIATLNLGTYDTRFAIYSFTGEDEEGDVSFFFNTGYTGGTGTGRGVWIDPSGNYHPTIRPNATNKGYLGTSSFYWYKLYVRTPYFINQPVYFSDLRGKTDIVDIERGTLSKLSQVRGVKYKLKLDEEDMIEANTRELYGEDGRPTYSPEADRISILKIKNELEKEKEVVHIGFIAQELLEVFPEVVDYDSENDTYGVKYTALIPILVEAIKEQQEEIETLKEKVALLEDK